MLGFLRGNLNISSTSTKEESYKSLVRSSLVYTGTPTIKVKLEN